MSRPPRSGVCRCGDTLRRVFTPPAIHVFSEHYNSSLGQPISDRKQFRDGLKRAEAEASERLGFDQHYSEVDPSDASSLGVTEEGLASQRAAWREKLK